MIYVGYNRNNGEIKYVGYSKFSPIAVGKLGFDGEKTDKIPVALFIVKFHIKDFETRDDSLVFRDSFYYPQIECKCSYISDIEREYNLNNNEDDYEMIYDYAFYTCFDMKY